MSIASPVLKIAQTSSPVTAPLKIGFLTPHNVLDRLSFSGTAFQAHKTLLREPGLQIRLLGPHHRRPLKLDRLMGRKPPTPTFYTSDLTDLDAVVGLVATPLLHSLARHSRVPFLHVTDATPGFLRDVYGWGVPKQADKDEMFVTSKAAMTVYSSSQMAARARDELGLHPARTHVLPFGINIDTLPADCPAKPPLSPVNLLFVGIDWTRKGGDIAVAALDHLIAAGHDATLTLVGRVPDALKSHPHVRVAGFLNKNRPRDMARLRRLYRDAHLLILPTRGDCTPMVIAEAMAHGTPVLATDTGGTAELIGGAGAGGTLPPGAAPGDWAKAISGMTAQATRYAFMSDAAFERAQSHYTWQAWAWGIKQCLQTVIQTRRKAA